ncbi:hypothetical protein BC826DRAFT_1013885 [Russula brevipes]|nr:hypothetical protein BC826DRAFT_1013885 [Russula brevipes]
MAPSQRRRSIDSSSSTLESAPNAHDDKKQTESHKGPGSGGSGDAQSPFPNRHQHEPPPSYTPSTSATHKQQPQAPAPAPAPPSGYRIPLSSPGPPPFPDVDRTRAAPFADTDGKSPVFIGSALMQYSVHPCKIAPNQPLPCYVAYGGSEIVHEGRYDLLPFVPEHMEFVRTSHGRVPPGRLPVKGGFENDGTELYHAVAVVNGVQVPGKTGTHLGGCNIPYGGDEHVMTDNYEILCWKF